MIFQHKFHHIYILMVACAILAICAKPLACMTDTGGRVNGQCIFPLQVTDLKNVWMQILNQLKIVQLTARHLCSFTGQSGLGEIKQII